MVTRRWRRRAVTVAAGVLLGGQAILGTTGAIAAPVQGSADGAAAIRAAASSTVAAVREGQPHQPRQLPEAGFDGILVAAIGTGLTGAGWLLMLAGSRRIRRRSR